MQNRLRKRSVRKQTRFSCYKRIHIPSGMWEYIRVNSMRFSCKSNNFTGTVPLNPITKKYRFEYMGPWDKAKYSNVEEEIEAVEPPMIEQEQEEILIPDSIKPKTTRRTRTKKKTDE